MPSLESIDDAIQNSHQAVANKVNAAIGWSNFRLAKIMEYSRSSLLAVGLSSVLVDSVEDFPVAVVVASAGGMIYIRFTESVLKQYIRARQEEAEQFLEDTRSQEMTALSTDTERVLSPVVLPCLVSSVLFGADVLTPLSVDPEVYMAAASAFFMYGAASSSAMYFADSFTKPTKGKLRKGIESLVETARTAFRQPSPLPNAQYAELVWDDYAQLA